MIEKDHWLGQLIEAGKPRLLLSSDMVCSGSLISVDIGATVELVPGSFRESQSPDAVV